MAPDAADALATPEERADNILGGHGRDERTMTLTIESLPHWKTHIAAHIREAEAAARQDEREKWATWHERQRDRAARNTSKGELMIHFFDGVERAHSESAAAMREDKP